MSVTVLALVIAAAAGPASAGSSEPRQKRDKVLLRDSLRKASAAFPESSSAEDSLRFEHHKMRVVQKVQGAPAFIEPAFDLSPDQATNVSVQVDVARNIPSTGVGVYCRRSNTGRYIFWLGRREWGIFKGSSSGLTELLGGKAAGAKPGKKTNEVRGECSARPDQSVELRMFVNGKEAGTQRDTTSPSPAGAVGLYIESTPTERGDASFSDLVIKQLRASV